MQQRCIRETETIERISVGMKCNGGELKGVVMQDVYHVLHDMRMFCAFSLSRKLRVLQGCSSASG